MPDNTNQTDSDTISTDDIGGGVKVQRVKVQVGTDGAASDVYDGNPLPTASAALAVRLDEASATISYVGEAPAGSLTSSAAWRIKKLNTASGTILTWADGDTDFDNVWDDRASLTYS